MRKTAFYHFIFLMVFVGGSALLYLFFWGELTGPEKIDYLFFMLWANIAGMMLLKISSLLEIARRDEIKVMEHRAFQKVRNDIEKLYSRIDDLEFPPDCDVVIDDGSSAEVDDGIYLDGDPEEK